METTKFRWQLFIALEQVAVRLLEVQYLLTRLGKSVAGKPRRLREAVRARENGLRMLLESSVDAIAVINADRRFVGANQKALDLFGISEANMNKFTVDAFFSHDQALKFDVDGLPLTRRRAAKHGKCEIRRLDGRLRIAEYIFVSHFAPFRHLCRFRNIAEINEYRPATLRTLGNRLIVCTNREAQQKTCCSKGVVAERPLWLQACQKQQDSLTVTAKTEEMLEKGRAFSRTNWRLRAG